MMHKLFRVTLLLALITGSYSLNAQSKAPAVIKNNPAMTKVRPAQMKPHVKHRNLTGFETDGQAAAPVSVPKSHSMLRSDDFAEAKVGTTTYDLQTNGTASARVHAWPDGKVSAAWTMSNQKESTGWPDRGTGFNISDNWNAATPVYPATRLESVRTGFTNYVVTAGGTEVVLAHQGSGVLNLMRRLPGQSTWTESVLPSAYACLWPKLAVDGETVYAMARTNTGVVVDGVEGAVLLWRSPNAGATWDKQDFIIPGLDSTAFATVTADAYSIDARDGIVAVGVFDPFNDMFVYKSYDNGDTWEAPFFIWDFPIDKYVFGQGYTPADLPVDADAPDSLAILVLDGSADLLIDNTGYIHFWTGEEYVRNVAGDATTYSYWQQNGLVYWRESDPETLTVVSFMLDINNNDTLDGTDIPGYGCGLSSMPAAASDENGGLYVVYASPDETRLDDNGTTYRHVYVTKSPDYGVTWNFPPIDLNYATDTDPDSNLAKISEGTFPNCDPRVTDKLHIVYQRSLTPGGALFETGNQDDKVSEMVYIGSADVVGTKTPVNNLDLGLTPNPATEGTAQLSFELKQSSEANITITDVRGALVRNVQNGTMNAGVNTVSLNVASLQNGVYFVQVQSGNLSGTKKLVVFNR
ncbi:MAG: T9SS type A sorting domain-containing protein [Saprospiraceae bacterium]|nr:T9SS type A sorting domain-containing protein [Saprospiraceae bacterium]